METMKSFGFLKTYKREWSENVIKRTVINCRFNKWEQLSGITVGRGRGMAPSKDFIEKLLSSPLLSDEVKF